MPRLPKPAAVPAPKGTSAKMSEKVTIPRIGGRRNARTLPAAAMVKARQTLRQSTVGVRSKRASAQPIKSPFSNMRVRHPRTATPRPQPTTETTAPAAAEEAIVTMPQAASARLVSKSKALTAWYNTTFGQYAASTAYLMGFMFIASAGSLLATHAVSQFKDWSEFQTAAICATIGCDEVPSSPSGPAVTESVASSTDGLLKPVIRFRTIPPSVVSTEFDIIVALENSDELQLFAESRTTALRTKIVPVPESTGTDIRFILDPKVLAPGDYQLRAQARASTGGTVINVTGARFTIQGAASNTDQFESASATAATSTEVANSTLVSPETAVPLSDSSTDLTQAITQDAPPPPSHTSGPIVALPVSPTAVVPVGAGSAADTPEFPLAVASSTRESSSNDGLAIRVALESNDGQSFVARVQGADIAAVELYTERTKASQPLFLGSAVSFENGYWVYNFNATVLPNGNYSIYARGIKRNGTVVLSERLALVVNSVKDASLPRADTLTASSSATVREVIAASDLPITRDSYLTSPTPRDGFIDETKAATAILSLPSERRAVVDTFVEQSFSSNETSINQLLQRYGSAYQSGDANMQSLARQALLHQQNVLTERALNDDAGRTTVTEIESQFALEFSRLTTRVEYFEDLIKDRSDGVSAVDSDQDGISDFDEENLYSTDAGDPDTDGDGTNDGTEIVSGFSPTAAEAEAIMTLGSPQSSGVVRNDVFEIQSVVPVLEGDSSRGEPAVQAHIRGRGLPNSYVTLFVYSTPVVVMVKTADDGSFTYEYERELEDGTHAVYAAITDNRGAILTKSEPYRFLKKAEAFTPLTATDATKEPEAPAPVTNVFLVISSLVVLTLGLILIILGLVVRRRQQDEEANRPGPPAA